MKRGKNCDESSLVELRGCLDCFVNSSDTHTPFGDLSCKMASKKRRLCKCDLHLVVLILFAELLCTTQFLRALESQSYTKARIAIGLKVKLLCSTEIMGDIHVQWLDPSGTTLTYDSTVETGDSRFRVDHSYQKEWNLEIENVRRSDAGNYTCNIGPTPFINKVVELIIIVAPSIVRNSADGAYLIGSEVTLICEAQGDPEPLLTWKQYSSDTGEKIDLEVQGMMLNISNITYGDAGSYECHAFNGVLPSAFTRIMLDVLFPPEISVLYHEMSQEEGASTLMTCLVRASPVLKLHWERNGTRLESSNKHQVHQWNTGKYQTVFGIVVSRLVKTDFGSYKCIASNEFGQAEETISIQEFKPDHSHIFTTPKDFPVTSHEDVYFDCTIHGLTANETLVLWHKPMNCEYHKIFMCTLARGFGSTLPFDLENYEVNGHYNLIVKQIDFNNSRRYICDIMDYRNYSYEFTVLTSEASSTFSCENETVMVLFRDTSTTLLAISLGSAVTIILAISIITVCCLMTFHKKELARYKKHTVKEKSTKNGNVDLELALLTDMSQTAA